MIVIVSVYTYGYGRAAQSHSIINVAVIVRRWCKAAFSMITLAMQPPPTVQPAHDARLRRRHLRRFASWRERLFMAKMNMGERAHLTSREAMQSTAMMMYREQNFGAGDQRSSAKISVAFSNIRQNARMLLSLPQLAMPTADKIPVIGARQRLGNPRPWSWSRQECWYAHRRVLSFRALCRCRICREHLDGVGRWANLEYQWAVPAARSCQRPSARRCSTWNMTITLTTRRCLASVFDAAHRTMSTCSMKGQFILSETPIRYQGRARPSKPAAYNWHFLPQPFLLKSFLEWCAPHDDKREAGGESTTVTPSAFIIAPLKTSEVKIVRVIISSNTARQVYRRQPSSEKRRQADELKDGLSSYRDCQKRVGA